jgi:2-polyprenyl-6-methoxyphenol hydroxylase-like FAD-dependent oxidoreductase
MLYKSIPNGKHLIKTGAKAMSIKETDQGVAVELEDGTVETGSVVIGADGVHGMTKKYIEEAMSKNTTEATDTTLFYTPTASQYYSIYAEGTNTKKIPSGIFYETRDTGRAIQLGADNDKLRIVMYRKLPQQMAGPVPYTAEQMEEFAEALFDMSVAPGVSLGEIWPDFHKHTARLVNQHEGFAKHWHTGRVVITSDASVCTSRQWIGHQLRPAFERSTR